MSAQNGRSQHVLGAVRAQVRLLIVTIAIIAVAVIGYLFWHSERLNSLEGIANHYHLESVLRCTEIKEEVHHLVRPHANLPLQAAPDDVGGMSASKVTNAVFVLEGQFREVSRLHAAFGAESHHARLIQAILDKAQRQLAGVKEATEKLGTFGSGPTNVVAALGLRPFVLSIEQLRRSHVIARDQVNERLHSLKASSHTHLQTIFSAALLLGSLVAWRVLSGIRRLIDDQRKTESILRQSATVFENTSEGVLITDTDANIVAVNAAFTEITGYAEQEVLGKNPRILKSGLHDREFYQAMWSAINKHGQWRGEVSDRRKNGETFPKWLTISAVRDDSGALTHYVSVFSDISQLKESAKQLHHLAHHDSLTGLPNRLLLNARLEHSLQHAAREGGNVAVLFLDIDHFKRVNDSLGHPAGDQLLKQLSNRLLASVRQDDTVARLGGDELTIVLGALEGPRNAASVAQEILATLSEPFELDGQEIFVSASIGISVYPQDGQDATALLKNADAAMYMAKNEGRSRYHFYSTELTAMASETLALQTHLHRALERDEFLLYYQPQISLQTGNIVGVEALLRWQHPEIGLVPPARFIPQAEESGLIEAIGKWVLRTACGQARAWQDAGAPPIRVSVNLSGRQLARATIVRDVREVLEESGLDPAYLELELTESSVMRHAEQAAQTLDELRTLGTTIAIDDFGTGYSSLSYLKRFAVDRLKIDRSFVHDIPHDANDVALAKAIVALAKSLNLGVVAEGIETRQQRDLLTAIGCDEMQGYLFSAPVPAGELAHLLHDLRHSACVND